MNVEGIFDWAVCDNFFSAKLKIAGKFNPGRLKLNGFRIA